MIDDNCFCSVVEFTSVHRSSIVRRTVKHAEIAQNFGHNNLVDEHTCSTWTFFCLDEYVAQIAVLPRSSQIASFLSICKCANCEKRFIAVTADLRKMAMLLLYAFNGNTLSHNSSTATIDTTRFDTTRHEKVVHKLIFIEALLERC